MWLRLNFESLCRLNLAGGEKEVLIQGRVLAARAIRSLLSRERLPPFEGNKCVCSCVSGFLVWLLTFHPGGEKVRARAGHVGRTDMEHIWRCFFFCAVSLPHRCVVVRMKHVHIYICVYRADMHSKHMLCIYAYAWLYIGTYRTIRRQAHVSQALYTCQCLLQFHAPNDFAMIHVNKEPACSLSLAWSTKQDLIGFIVEIRVTFS